MREWIRDKERGYVTFATSSKERKSLEVSLAGGYRVKHGAEIVYDGPDDADAVRAYNRID